MFAVEIKYDSCSCKYRSAYKQLQLKVWIYYICRHMQLKFCSECCKYSSVNSCSANVCRCMKILAVAGIVLLSVLAVVIIHMNICI